MKQNMYVWAMVGVAALIILMSEGSFLASIITTCTNSEPASMSEFEDKILSYENITYGPNGQYGVEINENLSYIFMKYTSTSHLGKISFIPMNNITCQAFLNVMSAETINTSTVYVNSNKVIQMDSNEYLWCNKNNNVALLAENPATINNYYVEFESCESMTVADDIANGEEQAPPPTIISTPQEEEEVGPNLTNNYDYAPLITIMAIIVIITALYYLFERGPKKGFIRGRRR